MSDTSPDQAPKHRLILELFVAYPRRSALIVLFLILAGAAEGIGIGAVLPLLGLTMNDGSAVDSSLHRTVTELLSMFGVSPRFESLLMLVVIGIALKAVLLLFAMREVSYAVVQMGTDLRLNLLRALMSAKWPYFLDQPVGSFSNAITTETDTAIQAYRAACQMGGLLFQMLVYIGLSLVLSWQVTVGAIAAGGALMFFLSGLVRVSRTAGRQRAAANRELVVRLTDGLSGM